MSRQQKRPAAAYVVILNYVIILNISGPAPIGIKSVRREQKAATSPGRATKLGSDHGRTVPHGTTPAVTDLLTGSSPKPFSSPGAGISHASLFRGELRPAVSSCAKATVSCEANPFRGEARSNP